MRLSKFELWITSTGLCIHLCIIANCDVIRGDKITCALPLFKWLDWGTVILKDITVFLFLLLKLWHIDRCFSFISFTFSYLLWGFKLATTLQSLNHSSYLLSSTRKKKKKHCFSFEFPQPTPYFLFSQSLRLIYYRFSVFWLFRWEAEWEDGTSSCSGCLGVLGVLARLPSRLAQPSGHALLWAAAGGWWGCRGWAREATDALNDLAWWDSKGLGARLASKTKQFFSDMWASVWMFWGITKKQPNKHRHHVRASPERVTAVSSKGFEITDTSVYIKFGFYFTYFLRNV